MLRRLQARLPDTNYGLSKTAVLVTAMRVAWLKSLVASLRFRGVVLIGRRSVLRVHRTARLDLHRHAILAIGLAHEESSGATIVLRRRSRLEVSGFVQVMKRSSVTVNGDATLSIHGSTYLNDGTIVFCGERLTIGSGCAISWDVTIVDTDVHNVLGAGEERPRSAPTEIGERCWIGAKAIVLKGVRIGPGCVVGAGSIVSRDLPDGSLAVGAPARVVRANADWRF